MTLALALTGCGKGSSSDSGGSDGKTIRFVAAKYDDDTQAYWTALIKDFEKVFAATPFRQRVYLCPFGSRYARWTRFFLSLPYVREFFTSHIWVLLQKDNAAAPSPAVETIGNASEPMMQTTPAR